MDNHSERNLIKQKKKKEKKRRVKEEIWASHQKNRTFGPLPKMGPVQFMLSYGSDPAQRYRHIRAILKN